MKKLTLILAAVAALSFSPVMASEQKDPGPGTEYPEYTGDLNDPDILVVHKAPTYLVITKNGKTYIYYR